MIKQKNQRTAVKSILGILTGLLEACGDDKVIHIPVLKHTHERIGIAANGSSIQFRPPFSGLETKPFVFEP